MHGCQSRLIPENMAQNNQPRVLTVAGSDCSGGAGIQADIKTITVLGGYASSAITALTAQNSLGVREISTVPAAFMAKQMTAVLEDIGADVIKIGMLGAADVILAVAAVLEKYPDIPVVLDPLMVATSGDRLIGPEGLETLKTHLIPKAELLTPNIPEAETLTGLSITCLDDMKKAASELLKLGCRVVLVKGGHLEGEQITDLLADQGGDEIFTGKRIKTRHSHGTGCTLSSAIAVFLASGLPLKKAVALAREYVVKAMVSAPRLGEGQGPLGHNFGRNLTN